MPQDHKALVRRYVEQFQSAGKEATADALVATDIHHHGPAWTRPDTSGRQGAKGLITMLRATFPDLHAGIHDQLVEGDKVMTPQHLRCHGRPAAPPGAPPSCLSRGWKPAVGHDW